MLDLEPIKARAALATKGPWEYDGQHDEITCPRADAPFYWLIFSECRTAPDEAPIDEFGHQFSHDFAFIASARADVPALVEEVARLREALTWYGNIVNYIEYSESENDGRTYIERDMGQRARALLTPAEAKPDA